MDFSLAENCSNGGFNCQNPKIKPIANCITAREDRGNKQHFINRKWCCYVNYNKVFNFEVEIVCCIQARDYKGFSSGFQYSNGIIEVWESS